MVIRAAGFLRDGARVSELEQLAGNAAFRESLSQAAWMIDAFESLIRTSGGRMCPSRDTAGGPVG